MTTTIDHARQTRIEAELEHTAHLTADQLAAFCAAKAGLRNATSLDAAYDEIRAWFPDVWIYMGGHHLAVHATQRDDRRIMIVREA